MTKINELIGQRVNVKIREIFGSVSATVISVNGETLTIGFTSFGSGYVMDVPKQWAMTKDTEGNFIKIAPKSKVIVNIETPEIKTKPGILQDVNNAGALFEFNGQLRFLTWESIKEVIVPRERDESKPKKGFPGKAAKPAAAPQKSAVPGKAKPAAPPARR